MIENQNLMSVNNHDLEIIHKNKNSTHYNSYYEFPVKKNQIYNYTATVKGEIVPNRSVIATFRSSGDVVENATRYGNIASNGRVLSLSPGSEIETTLEILKPSNYTIAVRAKTCQTCTFLRIEVDGTKYNNNFSALTNISNISLKDNISGLNWLASNPTYLKQGTYKFRIYSDSQTDLDSIVLYPSNAESSANRSKEHNETPDLFRQVSSLAQITGYEKINPTKHILSIKNATRPYIISFAESYDPLCTAYSIDNQSNNNNNFGTECIPINGVTNGFYVNKTGDYNLVIEYEPQKCFIQGAIISISTLIILLTITVFLAKKKYSSVTNTTKQKNSQT